MAQNEAPTSLTVPIGEEFQITLISTPSTGAIWYWQSQPSGPQLTGEARRSEDHSIGGQVSQVFSFVAHTKGFFTLTFHLKRAWEQAPREQKQIAVQVGP